MHGRTRRGELLQELDRKYHVWIALYHQGAANDLQKRLNGIEIEKEMMKYRAQHVADLINEQHSQIASTRAEWVHRDTDRLAHILAKWGKRHIVEGQQEIVFSAKELMQFLKSIAPTMKILGIDMHEVEKGLKVAIEKEKAKRGKLEGCKAQGGNKQQLEKEATSIWRRREGGNEQLEKAKDEEKQLGDASKNASEIQEENE